MALKTSFCPMKQKGQFYEESYGVSERAGTEGCGSLTRS